MIKIILPIVLLANLSLGITQLWLSSMRASDGQALSSIQAEAEHLSLENWRLKETIAEKTSLAYIAKNVEGSDMSLAKPQFVPASLTVAKGLSTP